MTPELEEALRYLKEVWGVMPVHADEVVEDDVEKMYDAIDLVLTEFNKDRNDDA